MTSSWRRTWRWPSDLCPVALITDDQIVTPLFLLLGWKHIKLFQTTEPDLFRITPEPLVSMDHPIWSSRSSCLHGPPTYGAPDLPVSMDHHHMELKLLVIWTRKWEFYVFKTKKQILLELLQLNKNKNLLKPFIKLSSTLLWWSFDPLK